MTSTSVDWYWLSLTFILLARYVDWRYQVCPSHCWRDMLFGSDWLGPSYCWRDPAHGQTIIWYKSCWPSTITMFGAAGWRSSTLLNGEANYHRASYHLWPRHIWLIPWFWLFFSRDHGSHQAMTTWSLGTCSHLSRRLPRSWQNHSPFSLNVSFWEDGNSSSILCKHDFCHLDRVCASYSFPPYVFLPSSLHQLSTCMDSMASVTWAHMG